MRTKKHYHRRRRGPCFCRRHRHMSGGGITDWWTSVTDKTKSWWQGKSNDCPVCNAGAINAAAPMPDMAAQQGPMPDMPDMAAPQGPMPDMPDMAAPQGPMPDMLDMAAPQGSMPDFAAPPAPPMAGGRRRRRHRRTRKHRRSRRHRRTRTRHRRRHRGGMGDFLTHDEKGSLATYASTYMGAPTAQPQVWTA
jgi:hypothetical protein